VSLNSLEINTSQNVLLRYHPAGVLERGLAWLIDSVLIFLYTIIIIIIAYAIIEFSKINMGDSKTLGIIVYVVFLIPSLLYHFICEYFFNGQSIGKKALSIRVVKLDGTQPTMSAYLLRWALRIIDFMIGPLIAVLSISVTKNFQRLGDIAAGTTIIKTKSPVTLKETILYKSAPDYQIRYMQVNKLSDRDIGIIKEIYNACVNSNDKDSMLKLAEKVRSQMGIATVNQTPEEFISTVLADYSQYDFES
jgi:uncharacterized RDD family membrane protein YckC